MATKNKHRRKNASNAVSRQHEKQLYGDNRTRAYTEILLVNIPVSIAFTGRFLFCSFFPQNGNVIPWLQHLLINVSHCFAEIESWFIATHKPGDRTPHLQGSRCIPSDLYPVETAFGCFRSHACLPLSLKVTLWSLRMNCMRKVYGRSRSAKYLVEMWLVEERRLNTSYRHYLRMQWCSFKVILSLRRHRW